ncbi:hypothetical protein EJ08DRAFT_692857 [Tothia fuscella]|uniref:Uncharacterized protein n=1 Tax=Tothia fuscella TaxID=1048955 RepID=A0A9P4NYT8_9PEZI|nr:hypothetical protein EJ08DRAFT_692857 [Tothia fuscella]
MALDTSQTPWLERPGPTYSWDLAPPTGSFWEDIGWRAATTFTCRYSSDELDSLELDSSLPKLEKLELLKSLLERRLAKMENSVAPTQLKVADRPIWHGLHYSITMFDGFLGRHDLAAEGYKNLTANADGKPNTGACQAVAIELYNQKNFAEAEDYGAKGLEGMRENYGIDSPPGQGMLRQMVRDHGSAGKV